MIFLGLKCDKAPFNNLKARQALNLAIDRKLIVDTLLKGAGRPAGAFIGRKGISQATLLISRHPPETCPGPNNC